MRGRMGGMDTQQQVIELLAEQNQLLKKYLWRVRFSLSALLLLTTGVAILLGVVAYRQHTARTSAAFVVPTGFGGPVQPALPPNYSPATPYQFTPVIPTSGSGQVQPLPTDPVK
jgi:hypothetical protein